MATSREFLSGRPGAMASVAGQLDPQPARDGKAAAEQTAGYAVECEVTLPGCTHFNTQLRAAAEKFGAFFAEADEGMQAFTSVGQVSGAEYGETDTNAGTPFQKHTIASPLTGTRPAL